MDENRNNGFLKNFLLFSLVWYLIFNFLGYSNTTASIDEETALSIVQEYKSNLGEIDFLTFEEDVDLRCYRFESWYDKDGSKFYDVFFRIQDYNVNSKIKLDGVRNEFKVTVPFEKVEVENLVDKESNYKGVISIVCLKPDNYDKMSEKEKEIFFDKCIESGRWFYNIYDIDFIFDESFVGSLNESKENIEKGIKEMIRDIEENRNT